MYRNKIIRPDPDEENKEQCPYDPVHRILPERFQHHLIRCRRSHPNQPTVVCPYNKTHIINALEEKYHLRVCDSIKTRLAEVIQPKVTKTFEPVPVFNLDIQCEENWDDVNVPTYDPTEHLEKNEIIRLAQNVIPSERKNFRQKERKRLAALQNLKAASDTGSNASTANKVHEYRRPLTVADTKLNPLLDESDAESFVSGVSSSTYRSRQTITSCNESEPEELAKKMEEFSIVGKKGKPKKSTKYNFLLNMLSKRLN